MTKTHSAAQAMLDSIQIAMAENGFQNQNENQNGNDRGVAVFRALLLSTKSFPDTPTTRKIVRLAAESARREADTPKAPVTPLTGEIKRGPGRPRKYPVDSGIRYFPFPTAAGPVVRRGTIVRRGKLKTRVLAEDGQQYRFPNHALFLSAEDIPPAMLAGVSLAGPQP